MKPLRPYNAAYRLDLLLRRGLSRRLAWQVLGLLQQEARWQGQQAWVLFRRFLEGGAQLLTCCAVQQPVWHVPHTCPYCRQRYVVCPQCRSLHCPPLCQKENVR